jgi:hypothetical protein
LSFKQYFSAEAVTIINGEDKEHDVAVFRQKEV